MITAIHQPNFLPWLGLFHRISLVDTFVFFDHVQAMNGKSWLSRNKILLNGKAKWLTIPVCRRGRHLQKITEVEINYESNFTRKHIGTLKQAYGKSCYYDEMIRFLESIYTEEFTYLSDFNKIFIMRVCKELGFDPKFLFSTEIIQDNPKTIYTAGNELVLEVCKAVGADAYISGTGCFDFIDPESFKKAGIDFSFQQFEHPIYAQGYSKEFVSHLSIIDSLFYNGFQGTRKLITEGLV